MQRIFLAHAAEDKEQVRRLYADLKAQGFAPWLDEEDLLPGQNWRVEIPKAIINAAIFIACLSSRSVNKQGYVSTEFRTALNAYGQRPPGQIYVIPVKLEACEVPDLECPNLGLSLRDLQWVELWEEQGFERLLRGLRDALGMVKRPDVDRVSQSPETNQEMPFDTWTKTPVSYQEFSNALFEEMSNIREGVKILIRETLRSEKADKQFITDTLIEKTKILSNIAREARLDIEITIFDGDRKYIVHPWDDIIGQYLCITMFNAKEKEGFDDWFWRRIEDRNIGYLSWIDQSSSSQKLADRMFVGEWPRKRKTVALFERVPNSVFGVLTIVIEGHEVVTALG